MQAPNDATSSESAGQQRRARPARQRKNASVSGSNGRGSTPDEHSARLRRGRAGSAGNGVPRMPFEAQQQPLSHSPTNRTRSSDRGAAAPSQSQSAPHLPSGSSSRAGQPQPPNAYLSSSSALPSPPAATPPSRRAGRSRGARLRFPEHLDAAALQAGLERGQLFCAVIRVNAAQRSEAYATLPGLPNDVLIKGPINQNRAVEGDEVALRVLPPPCWYTLAPSRRGSSTAADGGASSSGGGAAPVQAAALSTTGDGVDAVVAAEPAAVALGGSSAEGALEPAGASSVGGNAGGGSDDGPVSVLEYLLQRFKLAPEAASSPPSPGGEAASPHGAAGSEGAWFSSKDPQDAAAQILAALQVAPAGTRPTGQVVGILEPSRRRRAVVGVLKEEGGGGGNGGGVLLLVPSDPRLPRCVLRPRELPAELQHELRAEAAAAGAMARTIVSGAITGWDATMAFPSAQLRCSLGQAGELEAETAAILEAEQVCTDAFSDEVLECLPPLPWRVSEADVAARRDFRATRLFSIDPPTAKDLDDALSVERLPCGLLRVGVHIADVSHFVRPNTALDEEAAARGTSTYLVQRVIPMLPHLLCEELCSLNPGQERLAFSVVWDLRREDASVAAQWAGRSVIRSCAKLAYPHAQAMIDGRFDAAAAGMALDGEHTWEQVEADVLQLHQLAQTLRSSRFAGGALRLDNAKLSFALDDDGNPVDSTAQERTAANELVEEFMLLANMSVARMIADAYPERALLRRHPPPNERKLAEVETVVRGLGLEVDTSSAGALHASLLALRAECGDEDLADAVTQLVTRPMQTARYFSTGTLPDQSDWAHYALAVGAYTHFTSPIRRYPDILVHRTLAAVLDGGDPSAARERGLLAGEELQPLAEHCNGRKAAAKAASDASGRVFLCAMLARAPLLARAVVVAVAGAKFFDVFVPGMGIEQRVYVEGMLPEGLAGEWDAASRTLHLTTRARGGDVVAATSCGDSLRNPAGLAPLRLPLAVRVLDAMPVLLTARTSPLSGRFADVLLRPYLAW